MHATDSDGASVEDENGHCGAAAEVREAGFLLALLVFRLLLVARLVWLDSGWSLGRFSILGLSRTLSFSRPEAGQFHTG